MSGSEEGPYSLVFSALRHPTRRLLLRSLKEQASKRFSELQAELQIDSPTLSYHLDVLGGLVVKRDDRYSLTDLGTAACNLMGRVEETHKAQGPSISRRVRIGVTLVMAISLLIWGGFALTWTVTHDQMAMFQWHGVVYAHPISSNGTLLPPVPANLTTIGYINSVVYSRPYFLAGALTMILGASYLSLYGYSMVRPFLQRLTSHRLKSPFRG
jgi:DNA-binding transcriptional ArsR family regulator